METKQCLGCNAMVDVQKAFCPDCGTPMEEEQKRETASDYDGMAKTQNLDSTLQKQLLDDLNLSFIFASKKGLEASEQQQKQQVEREKETHKPPIAAAKQQAEPVREAVKKPVEPVIPKAENKAPNTPSKPIAAPAPASFIQRIGKAFNTSDKNSYLIIGSAILAFVTLFLISVVIAVLGYIYFWQR